MTDHRNHFTPTAEEYPDRRLSVLEEVANALTHGTGALLSVAALVILVVSAVASGGAARITTLAIYGSAMILLYLASTLYHAWPPGRMKRLFRRMDHTSIFLLIAGTYTPVALVYIRGGWGWTLFGLIWGIALLGIFYESLWIGRSRKISLILYLSAGWLVLIAVKPLIYRAPAGLAGWLLLGGLFYTSGVFFYTRKRWPFHHAIWHLFVLAGSVTHFFGFFFYIARIPG